MRNTKQLIEENNEKRELLNEENLELYEDFLLYIRMDLRIAEFEGEELLMELLDHLLEAQAEGKTAKHLFGDQPRIYADELIAGLPTEKKRNVIPFVCSQIANLLGWFILTFAIITLVLPQFTEIKKAVSLGSLVVILTAILLITVIFVNFISKLLRATLFVEEKQNRSFYWKAGLFGAGSFALIGLIVGLVPDFGPTLHFKWWFYLGVGAVLILISKVLGRMTK